MSCVFAYSRPDAAVFPESISHKTNRNKFTARSSPSRVPRRDNQSVGFIINPLSDYKSLVFLNSMTSCIPFIICKTSSYRLTNQTVWGLFETVRPRQCFYFRLRFFECRFLFSSSWRHSSWIGKLLPRVLLKREHSVATLFGKTGKIQRNKKYQQLSREFCRFSSDWQWHRGIDRTASLLSRLQVAALLHTLDVWCHLAARKRLRMKNLK